MRVFEEWSESILSGERTQLNKWVDRTRERRGVGTCVLIHALPSLFGDFRIIGKLNNQDRSVKEFFVFMCNPLRDYLHTCFDDEIIGPFDTLVKAQDYVYGIYMHMLTISAHLMNDDPVRLDEDGNPVTE